MTKQELITKVENKVGFLSIVQDALAPDNIPGDPISKRYLYINHTNADGTMGKTYVYYLWDTVNDVASFYNVETEALDVKEPSTDQKKLDSFKIYLGTNFSAYFILRSDLQNNWVEADVFTVTGSDLTKSTVLAIKNGTNPINHRKIV